MQPCGLHTGQPPFQCCVTLCTTNTGEECPMGCQPCGPVDRQRHECACRLSFQRRVAVPRRPWVLVVPSWRRHLPLPGAWPRRSSSSLPPSLWARAVMRAEIAPSGFTHKKRMSCQTASERRPRRRNPLAGWQLIPSHSGGDNADAHVAFYDDTKWVRFSQRGVRS